jgi:transglutaminase-like putative cysteine protease
LVSKDASRIPLELLVRAGCECVYRTEVDTPCLVLFKPRQTPTQLIREERIHLEPELSPSEFEDEHGNIVYRTVLRPGQNLLRYDSIVKVPLLADDTFRKDGVIAPQHLPPEVLRYTLPSRYADADNLRDFAWQHFGQVANGLARVQAICDWAHHNIEYRTFSGDPRLSASQVIERGFGVCRDLAHVCVALCRTFNLPARYVTGYSPDIGLVYSGAPDDFHAYFEVYVGDRWQTFDARHNVPRIGRIQIASGYDATNCAFTTLYGAAALERFEVWSYQVDVKDASTATPVDLSRRLDGTALVRRSR